MANTYTTIHIHCVFAVQYRASLIQDQWKYELYKYMRGIIEYYNHKVLAINGMPDHVHILFGMRPSQSLSELMQFVKGSSSKWINEQRFLKNRFEWQQGFGAFSYSKNHIPYVVDYIRNQEAHHKGKDFIEEYKRLLNESSTDFDEKYIFKNPE